MAGVYLLHFFDKINPDRPARHYLGYGADIAARTECQLAGNERAAALPYFAAQRGIPGVVARVWGHATRRDEYRLRQLKNNPKLCPICNPALALRTVKTKRGYWVTLRIGDRTQPRYGDLATLPPFKYRPKARIRLDGSHNYKELEHNG
jgi:hypothetical protein